MAVADGRRGPLRLPARDRLAQLEEGDDAGRDRQPEGDQPVGEHGREHLRAGDVEEHEGADHPRVHGPHPARGEREQVGDHADEESLHHDPERDLGVVGVERGPEDADVGCPEADGAEHREPAPRRVADEADRRARAACEGGGPAGQALRVAREPVPAREPAQAALDVLGDQGDQEEDRDRGARERRRDDRQAGRVGPVEDPGAQQNPVEHQGEHVDGVEQDQEGHHPAGRLAPRHPGLAKRPVGEHDAAGAAGREQPGRRQARHRDLVGLAPLQVQDPLADHAAEQRDVGEEGEHVEGERDRDPDRVGVAELVESVLGVEDLRHQDVDRRHQEQDDDQRLGDPLRIGEEGGLGLLALLLEHLQVAIDHLLVVPHLPEYWQARQPLATRSSRCTAALIRSASGSASGSPRRTSATSAAPAARSIA